MMLSRSFTIGLALATLALASRPAAAETGAEKGTFGIGLIIGEPTGISCKLYLGEDSNMAIDGGIGHAFAAGGLHIHADILWHPWILTTEQKFVLPAYLGVGARLLDHNRKDSDDDFHIGVRGVIGMVFDFTTIPLDAFVEFAGVLDYRTGSDDERHQGLAFDINAGAGVRYYF